MRRVTTPIAVVWVALLLLGCRCEPDPVEPTEAQRSARAEPATRAERPEPPRAASGERQPRWAGLRVHRVGAADADGPVVVLLHGYGAPGDDLVGFARALDVPRSVRFVLPEAPHARPPSGRMWWPVDLAQVRRLHARGERRDLSDEVPEGMPEARERVIALLDEVQRHLDVEPSQIVLGGFSQGAMLTVDVAAHDGRPLAGLLVMSGTLAAEAQWRRGLAAHEGLPVMLSHGRSDPLLPFAMAERLRETVRQAGLEVSWVPFDGGHTISPVAKAGAERFLRRMAGDGATAGSASPTDGSPD